MIKYYKYKNKYLNLKYNLNSKGGGIFNFVKSIFSSRTSKLTESGKTHGSTEKKPLTESGETHDSTEKKPLTESGEIIKQILNEITKQHKDDEITTINEVLVTKLLGIIYCKSISSAVIEQITIIKKENIKSIIDYYLSDIEHISNIGKCEKNIHNYLSDMKNISDKGECEKNILKKIITSLNIDIDDDNNNIKHIIDTGYIKNILHITEMNNDSEVYWEIYEEVLHKITQVEIEFTSIVNLYENHKIEILKIINENIKLIEKVIQLYNYIITNKIIRIVDKIYNYVRLILKNLIKLIKNKQIKRGESGQVHYTKSIMNQNFRKLLKDISERENHTYDDINILFTTMYDNFTGEEKTQLLNSFVDSFVRVNK